MNEEYINIKDKTSHFIKKQISTITLVFASIFFVLKEVLELQRTDKDLITILMSIGLTYFFTIYISLTLRRIGKNRGKDTMMFKNTLSYLDNAKKTIKDILFLLPVFCRMKNKEAIKEVRELYLEAHGMTYELWQSDFYKDDEEAQKVIKKMLKLKISNITPHELLSEAGILKKGHDPLYLGKTEMTDSIHSTARIMISKILLPIIFGYFAVTIMGRDGILWGLIQVSIILVVGVTYLLEGEEFVLTDLRNRFIKKADLLLEFDSIYKHEPEKLGEIDTKQML